MVVSICSFVLAFASFAYTVRSKRRDANAAARNDFHSCISKISEIRSEREEKERELKDDFESLEHRAMRARLNDKLRIYLSKAVLLRTRYRRLDISSFENLLLGAALADQGRYTASLRYYRRAVRLSADSADKALAMRVYGRAMIGAGYPWLGRRKMLKATRLFSRLSNTRGYDRDLMIYESTETYSRLVRIELRCGYLDHVQEDLNEFEWSIPKIKHAKQRQSMEELLTKLKKESQPDPTPSHSETTGAQPGGISPGSL